MPKKSRHQYNEVDAAKVEALASYGITQKDIANTLGMDIERMCRLYQRHWELGRSKANAQIGKKLFEKAINGDTACLMFWAKCQMRWREKEGDTTPAHDTPYKGLADAVREAIRSVG